MIELRIDTAADLELLERDRDGNMVDEKAATSNVCVCSTLQTARGELGFLIVIRIDKALGLNRDQRRVLARNWLRVDLPARLAKANHLDFYGPTYLQLPPDAQQAPDAGTLKPMLPVAIECTPNLAKSIEDTVGYLEAIRKPFEAAKAQLYEWVNNNTAFGFKQTLNSARGHLSKIEHVLECSGNPYQSGPQHVRDARRNYEELARRQVETNVNYRHALRDLQLFTSMLAFPLIWGRKPTAF